MTDDRVTAALDEIRERAEDERRAMGLADGDAPASADDVPSLVAALDGVLALVDQWYMESARLDVEFEQVSRSNAGGRVLVQVRSELRKIHAQSVREAISAALLGEDAGGG